MAERDAFVEHKALAAPTARGFRHLLEISQDAALEVVDLSEPTCEQQRTRFLAADAAGAEHRDPLVLRRIKLPRGEFLELTEGRDAGINRALERAHRDLERVAGVDDKRIG